MGVPQELSPPRAGGPPDPRACPRCGDGPFAIPGVACPTLGGASVRRCVRCATRWVDSRGNAAFLFTCESCGLPFSSEKLLAHGEQRCGACVEGRIPAELPDARVSEAVEHEIRSALDGRWKFGTAPVGQAYLDRIARHVAARSEGAPSAVRVVVVDTDVHRALALPSGTLLLSAGALAFLEDEAELAFVLGHELAHAASGDAAVRLSRLGFRASGSGGDRNGEAWADAASDLGSLGYGRHRERDADARAVLGMLALGYDALAASRYLERLEVAIEAGDPAVAETALAHPTPAERKRRLSKLLYGRVAEDVGPLKVNREVFRRAVPKDLGKSLVPVRLCPEARMPRGDFAFGSVEPESSRLPWAALAAVLAAAALFAIAAMWLL
ncbi:MAG TPA: M48 family metallopeptidase [Candidatus Polarisedimenticolaceae bacterium]